MKTTVKKSAAKKSQSRSAIPSFKEGQKVRYEGHSFTVKRAYQYKGRPFCIIAGKDGNKQVSANSLK